MQYIKNVPINAILEVRREISTENLAKFEEALKITYSYTYFQVIALMNDINVNYSPESEFFVITYQNHPVVALMDNSSTLVKHVGYDTESYFDLDKYVNSVFPHIPEFLKEQGA